MEEESGTGCRAVERNPIFFAVSVDTGLQSKLNVHFLPAAVARWWACAREAGQTHTSSSTAAEKPHCEIATKCTNTKQTLNSIKFNSKARIKKKVGQRLLK